MRTYITINDINRRKLLQDRVVAEGGIDYTTDKNCFRLYEQAKRTNSNSDTLKFFKEVASSFSNSTNYVRTCVQILEESDNKELFSIFKESILPQVDEYTLNDMLTVDIHNKYITECIKDTIIKNKVTDRILNNNRCINEVYNIYDNFYDHYKIYGMNHVLEEVADIITDNYKYVPLYGKFNIAIDESLYLLNTYGITYNENDVVNTLREHLLLTNEIPSTEYIKALDKVISENYCLHEGLDILNVKDRDSKIIIECDRFINSPNKDKISLSILKSKIVSADEYDIKVNFGKFLSVLTRLQHTKDKELIEYINTNLLPSLHNEFMRNISIYEDPKKTFESICSFLKKEIDKIADKLTTYNGNEDLEDQLEKYMDILQQVYEDFDYSTNFISTSYNNECATKNLLEIVVDPTQVLTGVATGLNSANRAANKAKVTMKQYNIFKFDNLITRTYKVDRYIQKQFEPKRNEIINKIKATNKKIFESASVYDVVLEDGSVDYCFATYEYDNSIDLNRLHEYCSNVIKYANDNILNESNYICYYDITPDLLEFHIREGVEILLDNDDKQIIESYISDEDLNRMYKIMYFGNICEDMNIVECAIEYFSTHIDNTEEFKSFIESCSNTGIDKSIIRQIYEGIIESTGSISFITANSYLIDSYTINTNNSPIDSIEEYANAQSIISEAYKSKYADYVDDEDEEDNNDDEDEDEDEEEEKPKKPAPKKEEPTPKPERQDTVVRDRKSGGSREDIVKDSPLKNMTGTNLKLMGKGIGKAGRDVYAKQERLSKAADASFDHFSKSIKNALVSDRREAIIKGSIIPSFSRCVKIGIGLVVLGGVAKSVLIPVITALGAMGVSKHLTKKERILLLDEIDTELQVIEKEIQMADANNQTNKYRELLKCKKELQRQYQRIKFNVKVGKDLLPSTVGTPGNEND